MEKIKPTCPTCGSEARHIHEDIPGTASANCPIGIACDNPWHDKPPATEKAEWERRLSELAVVDFGEHRSIAGVDALRAAVRKALARERADGMEWALCYIETSAGGDWVAGQENVVEEIDRLRAAAAEARSKEE